MGEVFPYNFSGTYIENRSFSIPNYKAGTYTISVNYKRRGRVTTITNPNPIILRNSPNPHFAFNGNADSLYAPATLTLINQTIKGDGDSLKYTWNFGDQTTSLETNPVHTYSIPGTYNVGLKTSDDLGCNGSFSNLVIIKDSVQRNEINYITSNCSENEEPSCGWGKHFIIEDDTLRIYGNIGGNCCTTKTATVKTTPDTVFIQTFEYGPLCTCSCTYCFAINVPGIKKDSIIVSINGQYYVANNTINGIDIFLKDNGIIIFPNPVKDNFTIDLSALKYKKYQIEIFDISGVMVLENRKVDDLRINISSKDLKPGIYFIKTIGDNLTTYWNRILIE
jgi:hypothetical protein